MQTLFNSNAVCSSTPVPASRLYAILAIFAMVFGQAPAQAQCGSGTTAVSVNFDWQYFDTLPSGSSGFRYMLGKSSVVLKWTGTNTFYGTTGAHSGSGSSYGSGDDMKFVTGNGADTLSFQDEVQNVRFSLYDIDNRQVVAVNAQNTAGTAQTITMSKVSGTILTISGSGTTVATATAGNTAAANTSTDGTVNVSIAGPVKTIVLTHTKSTGTDSLYLSDITACLPDAKANWAVNSQVSSTPEPGQPTLTLATYNNHIYVVDLTNKTSSILYTDAAFNSINSLAYDPNNQVIYYTNNARNSTNKSVFKYDVRSGVRSVFISDARDLGILLPASVGSYLGSAGAAFYDGSLFLATDANNTIGDAASIYRIEIDSATQQPVRASRVWSKVALPIITSRYFDWSDFVIKNGTAYCFNQSIPSPAKFGAFHISLNTQDTIAGYTTAVRSQACMDYNENIYHLGAYGALESYNESGGFTSLGSYTRVNTADSLVTDGGDSFKYPYDFGHFAAYGNAYHLYNTAKNLVIGSTTYYSSTYDRDKLSEDNDGVSAFPDLNIGMTAYSVEVSVTNTTGSDAVLYGYVDFNADGDFSDAGEQSFPTTVANGATLVTVYWSGLGSGAVGSTAIRFRLAPNAGESGMASGYASNGEVEDHTIYITMSLLPVELMRFTGSLQADESVRLEWATASESGNDHFDVQRSTDTKTWETLGRVKGQGFSASVSAYNFPDPVPNPGDNYYRLLQEDLGGRQHLSDILLVRLPEQEINEKSTPGTTKMSVYPNPTAGLFRIRSNELPTNPAIFTLSGNLVRYADWNGYAYEADLSDQPPGLYIIQADGNATTIIKQ